MKYIWNKKTLIFTILVILAMPLIILSSPLMNKNIVKQHYYNQKFEKALVTKIIESNLQKDHVIPNLEIGTQKLKVKILTGKYKGGIYETTNLLSRAHNVLAKENLKIVVGIRETDDGPNVWVYNHVRSNVIYFLIGLFFILMLIFGGINGFKAVLSLIFTGIMLIFVLVPMIFMGKNPMLSSILIVSIICVISFLLIGGFDKKTLAAIIGTIAGVVVAGIISYISGNLAYVTGLNVEKGVQLVYIAQDYNIQVKGLLFSAILIASLGAVMDVAMSIASSIFELHRVNENLSAYELLKSGLNIGKDIMGTMSNTLILAFAGSSLALILLIWGYQMEFTQMINMPFIAVQIIQSISGSIGIILTVPFTAAFSVFLIKNEVVVKK
ncbi:YibE/F family protein [Helicovermis profundi]|uniref:YibE/F family protein n=1 Tax=Helicovermis profundi TaxID=3065157 RepID=A0AAU9ETW9_9FIRM|nr:YibE/F family protein [Clostridia bacterium S502]